MVLTDNAHSIGMHTRKADDDTFKTCTEKEGYLDDVYTCTKCLEGS